MGEVRVVGIRVEQPQNQPVLLLREANGDRYLPIWIGQSEAAAIALEQQGVEPARPLAFESGREVRQALGHAERVGGAQGGVPPVCRWTIGRARKNTGSCG